MQAPPSSSEMVWLTISGLGHVVSFKNNKVILSRGKGGKPLPRPMLITKSEFKKQMDQIVESFVSQLFSKCRTGGGATEMAPFQPSSIALLLPEDDSLNDIVETHVYLERVTKGEEGAEIIIEPMT